MPEIRTGPVSAVTATLIYVATFLLCLVGAGGVLAVVGLLVLADVLVGMVRGDLATRVRRPRW
ncbi:MAG: hypothetical protein HRU14_10875 [Planctomycetes bacterium]|nr:hypothetical protein [Planctomycetota bacterium]